MRTAESVVLTDWPPGPGRAVDVDLEVVRVDLHVDVLGLGQHGDGRRRGVDAALRLGLRHALHAVRAALVLEHAVGALALDRERVVAVADLERLLLEAAPLGVARQHPVEVGGEQARPPPRPCPGGSRRSRPCRRWGRARPSPAGSPPPARPSRSSEPRSSSRTSGSSPSSASSSRAPAASSVARRHSCGQRVRRLERAVGAADLGVAALVADHLGVRHLLRELGEAALDLLHEPLDHADKGTTPAAGGSHRRGAPSGRARRSRAGGRSSPPPAAPADGGGRRSARAWRSTGSRPPCAAAPRAARGPAGASAAGGRAGGRGAAGTPAARAGRSAARPAPSAGRPSWRCGRRPGGRCRPGPRGRAGRRSRPRSRPGRRRPASRAAPGSAGMAPRANARSGG